MSTDETEVSALRLLVIEDNRSDADLMLVRLKQHGLSIDYDYVATWDEFRQHIGKEYDAILCDHDLRTWLGIEALTALRGAGNNTPFIVTTGTIGEEAAVEYMRQGATDYVLKDRLERLPMVLTRALQDRAKAEENRRLQEGIRSAKREWELTFDAVPDAVLVLDAAGTIRRVNRAAATLMSRNYAELIGRAHGSVFHVSEEHPHNCPFCAMVSTGRYQRCDIRLESLSRTFDVVAAPMRQPNGDLRGGTVVMRDVSQRLKLDEQLRQAQKMEAVGLLAGGIAHDFNNLLNVISGNAEILQSQQLEPFHDRELKEIREATRRAARLTGQLMAFSRSQILQPRVLDLNAVITDIEKMLRRLIGEDITIVTRLDRKVGSVMADQGQLGQVLMNLATNARDAMPEGGRLFIRTQNVELTLADREKRPYVRPGKYVCLSVIDSGTGMPPEVCNRVFEPFFTTKEKGHGTGLGLSVVYGVVKQSGGYVWCTSELGKGTAFTIYLPRVSEAPTRIERETDGETSLGEFNGSETILVVEDEEALLHVIRQFLVRSGYSVLGANSPSEAIDIAHRHKEAIPLVIMDTVLPEMNGRMAAEELKKIHPEMTFLFMSGYIDRPILEKVIEERAPFLQKPITKAVLLRKVHELLHTSDRPEVSPVAEEKALP